MITGRDAERLAYMGKSNQRVAVARQRKRRQMRWFWLAVFVAIAFVILRFWVRDSVPEAPGLVVRWPKPKVSQRVSSGSTLLVRAGNAFVVSITEPDKWDVFYTSDSAQGRADGKGEVRWLPRGKGWCKLRCRARASGWKSVLSWFWPQPELALAALAPQPAGDLRLKAEPPKGGMWVYPFVYLKAQATWDEQALQLLTEPLLPALAGRLELSSPASMPASGGAARAGAGESAAGESAGDGKAVGVDKPLWTLVPSFASGDAASSPADAGTYAKLNTAQPERDMARVAALIAKKRPDASLRYVVRLDTKPPGGILRIALDGKGDRKAWVRRAGESSGGPIVWPAELSDAEPSGAEPSGTSRKSNAPAGASARAAGRSRAR